MFSLLLIFAALVCQSSVVADNAAPQEPAEQAQTKESPRAEAGKSVSALGTEPWMGKGEALKEIHRVECGSIRLPIEWWSVQTFVPVGKREVGPSGYLQQVTKRIGENVLVMEGEVPRGSSEEMRWSQVLKDYAPLDLPSVRLPNDGRLVLIWECSSSMLQVQMGFQFYGTDPDINPVAKQKWGVGVENDSPLTVILDENQNIVDTVQVFDPTKPPPWREFYSFQLQPGEEFGSHDMERTRYQDLLGALRVVKSEKKEEDHAIFSARRVSGSLAEAITELVVAVEEHPERGKRVLFWFEKLDGKDKE